MLSRLCPCNAVLRSYGLTCTFRGFSYCRKSGKHCHVAGKIPEARSSPVRRRGSEMWKNVRCGFASPCASPARL